MRKALARVACLFAVAADALPATHAQPAVAIAPQQCVWRAGDDARWAAPDLDESGWQPYTGWALNARESQIWVRCHANLAGLRDIPQPALQVYLSAAYELFLNGRLVGSIGSMLNGNYSENSFQTFPLASSDLLPNPGLLAVRILYRSSDQTDPLAVVAGDVTRLRDRRDHEVVTGILGHLIVGVCYTVIGVIGFLLLGLYLVDRERLELLLLALCCWLLAIVRLDEFCVQVQLPFSFATYSVLYGIGQLMMLPYVFFVFRLAHRRVPWPLRLALLVTLSFPAEILITTFLPAALSLRIEDLFNRFMPCDLVFGILLTLSSYVAFWPWKGIARRMRPVGVCCMLWGAADAIWFAAVLASFCSAAGSAFFRNWSVSLLEARAAGTASVLVALLALLFRDQRRVAEDRAQLAGEIASAREIQQYLIPAQLPPTPGLDVETVYHPSREVGGDFFQVLPDARDGSTLIVVGDVAGKGLQAGMLAALIVGAIRTAAKFTTEPAEILALLNERLQRRGLVTCLAMRLEQDGQVTLANAGHLPPYRNADELEMEGALPLGAVPGIAFPAMRFQLDPGETLMLMSDGIAEAQDTEGRLFGFERIGAMLREKATPAKLAAAAQQFGQEDDITVLSLTWAPVDAVHA